MSVAQPQQIVGRWCSECDTRPARRAVLAIIGGEEAVRCELHPPEPLCLTCYEQQLRQAAEDGLRLETLAVGEDAYPFVEVPVERVPAADVAEEIARG